MEDKIVTDNINLIYHVLKKYGLYRNLDEYYDVGLIGLVKGVKSYDNSKGYAISTYLVKCITTEVLAYQRKTTTKKRGGGIKDISIYTPINDEENELLDVIPSNENIEENIIKKEQLEMIYKEIFKLKERDRLIICSSYGVLGYEKLTQKEVSETTGVSQPQVSRITKKFIEDVRRKYE